MKPEIRRIDLESFGKEKKKRIIRQYLFFVHDFKKKKGKREKREMKRERMRVRVRVRVCVCTSRQGEWRSTIFV